MRLSTRKLLDRSFTGLGVVSIGLVALVLVVLLGPIVVRGVGAYVFRATVEHREVLWHEFEVGDPEALESEVAQVQAVRQPVYDALAKFEPGVAALAYLSEVETLREELAARTLWPRDYLELVEEAGERHAAGLAGYPEHSEPLTRLHAALANGELKRGAYLARVAAAAADWRTVLPQYSAEQVEAYLGALEDFKYALRELLGPLPGEAPVLERDKYGVTRWDARGKQTLRHAIYQELWVRPEGAPPTATLVKRERPWAETFRGTTLEPTFAYIEEQAEAMLHPRWTFYWRFLTLGEKDAHFFGGIWGEMLGTLYLTLGAVLFAVPMGIISAIYLVEYAGDNALIRLLRSCISTLAGVPSIVFGLFGLAFFINAIHVSPSKSVLAGSLTLALLILPVVIRAAEEAIRAVPKTYREAALSVGASKWHTILTVILPAALPGVLTGIVISMGRAAGETAPIIFTAAVSFGAPLAFHEVFDNATRALPWGVYNMATEHEEVDQIRHVQYGMVFTLVALVLLLNAVAIVMRARIARKLAG